MRIRTWFRLAIFAVGLVVSLPSQGEAITFQIINLDSPGEGLNDNFPATPVGGNTGTTIGEQRQIAFQYAADLWGSALAGDIPIRVEASFDELSCSDFGAVFGQAGPTFLFRNFNGAPL